MKSMIDARKKIKERVERFKEESDIEREERHEKVCSSCLYFNDFLNACEYSRIAGQLRPCAGIDCKKEGVYVKGKLNNRSKSA